jgi:hypothetical protein
LLAQQILLAMQGRELYLQLLDRLLNTLAVVAVESLAKHMVWVRQVAVMEQTYLLQLALVYPIQVVVEVVVEILE